MSEAIISRRGYGPNGKPKLFTETVVTNSTWTVPNDIRGNITVHIFGGGGGSINGTGGGGGGWMNNGEFNFAAGTQISITIGIGGNNTRYAEAGGTSAFGTYLSANGGGVGGARSQAGGNGGSGGGSGSGIPGIGYQFGGGGGGRWSGGKGGTWGGGGGGGTSENEDPNDGGDGGQYGGGGGAGGAGADYDWYTANGGKGGIYGGGGGGMGSFGCINRNSERTFGKGYGGAGGTYGGKGGDGYVAWSNGAARYVNNAQAGTNTMNNQSVDTNYRGPGLAGPYNSSVVKTGIDISYVGEGTLGGGGGGGGGFGSNGGVGGSPTAVKDEGWTGTFAGGGGGGGYGINATGGNGGSSAGGGGGGYMSRGGDGFYDSSDTSIMGGGGGGGYFGNGANGVRSYGGGGGGWMTDAIHAGGAGYSIYGMGAYGRNMGTNGVCLIQYYI